MAVAARAPSRCSSSASRSSPPSTQFQGTTFGGLSSIAYDSAAPRLLRALGRSSRSRARFYTLRIGVGGGAPAVEILAVTTLRDASGQPFASLSLDPEGLTLTKRDTLVITSEGFANRLIDPWVREFGLDGRQLRAFPLPSAFLPVADGSRGVRLNLGFESAGPRPAAATSSPAPRPRSCRTGRPSTLAAGSPARLLRYDLQRGTLDRQFVYWTDRSRSRPCRRRSSRSAASSSRCR